MPVNIYNPFPDDGLEPEEQVLYDLVNQYRAQNGLAAIPLSKALTLVANRHVHDLTDNIRSLTHSWSDAVYDINNSATWSASMAAPQRLGTGYTGNGYENAYWSSGNAKGADALALWKTDSHNDLLLNLNIWQNQTWKAMGIGIYGQYAVLWMGDATDTTGTVTTPPITTTPTTAVRHDINGVAGQAYRIYKAAFDRTPDLTGLGYWIKNMDNGSSLQSVANGFINSAEFKTLYGTNPSHESFIAQVYTNVLHRAIDQSGFNFWLSTMQSGANSQAAVLAQFSESPENQAAVIGLIGNGIEYTPFF